MRLKQYLFYLVVFCAMWFMWQKAQTPETKPLPVGITYDKEPIHEALRYTYGKQVYTQIQWEKMYQEGDTTHVLLQYSNRVFSIYQVHAKGVIHNKRLKLSKHIEVTRLN